MKKNIITIIFIITISFLVTNAIFKVDFKKSFDYILDRYEVVSLKRKGYVVLKDMTRWYEIESNDNSLTLISAGILKSDGTFDYDNSSDSYRAFDNSSSCIENDECSNTYNPSINSNIAYLMASTYFSKLIDDVKAKKVTTDGLTMRMVTFEDLKTLGCDIDNMSCKDSKEIVTSSDYFIASSLESSIYMVSKENSNIVEVKPSYEAGVRMVVTVDKSYVY